MMKRVGLSRFSPLEVSRKVQQCLRFEGVNTNGVDLSDENFADDNTISTADSTCHSHDAIMSDGCCNNSRSKDSILTVIKRKLKKAKRSKRFETRQRPDPLCNMCQCHSENCASYSCCSTNGHRIRKHKTGEKCYVWPMSSSVLRCHNHQLSDKDCDEAAKLLPSQSNTSEPVTCTCFSMTSGEDCVEVNKNSSSSSKPDYQSSSDLLNISSDVTTTVSSLTMDPQINDDVPYLSSSSNTVSDKTIYSGAVCDINENIESKNPNTISCVPRVANLTQELYKLSKYGWYWGPINQSEAESKLIDQSDGAFLVRDSSDDRYILSLSFRSCGQTLHTRIEHSNGLFSFYAQHEPEGRSSIVELIEQSMWFSQSGVFCYSRSRSPGAPSFPVRLTKPVSRFTQVRSLQYLCRFVIRQFTRFDHIQELPLPPRIKGYLEEGHY